MKKINYYIVYPFAYLIGLMPYKVQFFISDVIRWVLYKVVRYRVAVVRNNLQMSFPEKSVEQRKQIERNFYKHLADVFLETLSLASVKAEPLKKRMEFINVDQIEKATKNKSWVCAMAHYGNWEYTVSYALHSQHDGVLAVYKPLRDHGFEKIYHRLRSRFGAVPTAMNDVGRVVISGVRSNKSYAVALISDQNPPMYEHSEWIDFLGQKTLFFGGMEKFALKFGMPVAFLHVDKCKRGYYRGWFELIYDGQENLQQGEITKRYAKRLEEMIRRRPELWMWSHKRWKHNYERDRNYFERRKTQ